MNDWPKRLGYKGTIATLLQVDDEVSAEYIVFSGGWSFTADRYFGHYYITAVDGYTQGRIADGLVGLELEEVPEEVNEAEYQELGFVMRPIPVPTGKIFKMKLTRSDIK